MKQISNSVDNIIGKLTNILKNHYSLVFLFLFAFLLRFVYMLLMLQQHKVDDIYGLFPDTERYVAFAHELLKLDINNEGAVFVFGPGYGMFLGMIFLLFGSGSLPILIIQIILDSICALLLYKLASELTGSSATGYVAGLLSAISFTAISLSNAVLSDSFFFFLFILGNLLFVIGLRKKRLAYYVSAGIILGWAVLTRSVVQFWPLVMILYLALIPVLERASFNRKNYINFIMRAAIAPLIVIVITGIWITRNYVVHDVPVVAFAGPHGIARLTSFVQATVQGKPYGEADLNWEDEYRKKYGVEEITAYHRYRMYQEEAVWTLKNYPRIMLNTYFYLVWDNLTAVNELYRVQLPKYKSAILALMYKLRDHSLHQLCFFITILGMIGMAIRRRWRALLFLGLAYIYFVAMIGFGSWQGSRLFYPAQMSWAIIIGWVIVDSKKWLKKININKILTLEGHRLLPVIFLIVISITFIVHAISYSNYIVDDAGISFTYSKNLACGNGLVFNPGGEKVEGYSNPLWVFLCAALIKLRLFDPIITPKVISIMCTIFLFTLIYIILRCYRTALFSQIVFFFIGIALALNVSNTVWSVGGLENALYILLILLSAYRLFVEMKQAVKWPLSGVLFFLVAITRPDGIVYSLAAGIITILFIQTPRQLKLCVMNAAEFILLYGGYHIVHFLYFREILPNTYYAKQSFYPLFQKLTTFDRWGWMYLRGCIRDYGLFYFVPAILMALMEKEYRLLVMLLSSFVLATLAVPFLNLGDWMTQYRLLFAFIPLVLIVAGIGFIRALERFSRFPRISLLIMLSFIIGIGYASGSYFVQKNKVYSNYTVPFNQVKQEDYYLYRALADSLMITNSTVLIPDLGATGYYGHMTIYDVGLLADYHLARYRYREYFTDYVFAERRPEILGMQGGAVASQTRMSELPELGLHYLVYAQRPIDYQRYGPGLYDGIYIRKDLIVLDDLPGYAAQVNDSAAGNYGLAGFCLIPAYDPLSPAVTIALYWRSPAIIRANSRINIRLENEGFETAVDSIVNIGYNWYSSEKWRDTGYVCQYLILDNTYISEGNEYRASLKIDDIKYDLGRFKYSDGDYRNFVDSVKLSLNDRSNISPIKIKEAITVINMASFRFWESKSNLPFIDSLIENSAFQYPTIKQHAVADSALAILEELKRLSPSNRVLADWGQKLWRYYYCRAENFIQQGFAGYPEAYANLHAALRAYPGFPETRQKIEFIRPWVSYLSDHPGLIEEYSGMIPVEKWLKIYRDFLRDKPIKRKYFKRLFTGGLVDVNQVRNELASLTTLDRLQLKELGLVSKSVRECIGEDAELQTFGDGMLEMVDCRISHLDSDLYLFEAIFIPHKKLNHNYAISLNIAPTDVSQLPEEIRFRGTLSRSFHGKPLLRTMSLEKPHYLYELFDLEFNPTRFEVTIYVPGGPPWYPLLNDNQGDNFIRIE